MYTLYTYTIGIGIYLLIFFLWETAHTLQAIKILAANKKTKHVPLPAVKILTVVARINS